MKTVDLERTGLDNFRQILKNKFFEPALLSLMNNRIYGDIISRITPNHYLYNDNETRLVRRNNVNYRLNISDIIDWYIFFGFQEKSKNALLNLAKTEDIIFDIGTNVGEVSMRFANIIGNNGKVHSFEPSTTNFNRFKENLKLNSFNNIKANNFGLASDSGTFKLHTVNSKNRGMNRILTGMSESKPESEDYENINVKKLDNYVSENKIERINLIKIDVEGFEMEVLKGSVKSISKFQPTLFIELDDNNLKGNNSTAKELVQFLENLDYTITHSDSLDKITSGSDFNNCHFDVIAKVTV